MAIVSTNQNLTAVSYTAGETIFIRNGATLTIDSTPATRPGSIICTTTGRLLITNSSTTVPIKLELNNVAADFQFEGQGIFEVQGQMMELGTGNGAQQTFDLSTLYGGVLNDLTYIEVETSSGSGVYMPWYIFHTDSHMRFPNFHNRYGSIDPSILDGTVEGVMYNSLTRVITTGNNTNCKVIPTGCKIRIPNILITQQDWHADTALIHALIATTTTDGTAPTGGTFTITVINRRTGTTLGTTGAIAWNASSATIDSAIEAITGAGTITSAGGALPTTVTLTLAGAYASTPLAFVVDSSLITPAAASVKTCENSVANLNLLDLNAGGTFIGNNCMFSQKFNWTVAATGSLTFNRVGLGCVLSITGCNFPVTLDHVSIVQTPHTSGAAYQTFSNIVGDLSINKLVVTSSTAACISMSICPNVIKADDIRTTMRGVRSYSAAAYGISATSIKNGTEGVIFNRPHLVGSGTFFVDSPNTKIISPRISDSPTVTQQTVTSTIGFTISTGSNDCIVYDMQSQYTWPPRGQLVSQNAAISGTKIIKANVDSKNHGLGFYLSAGNNLEIIDCVQTNVRAAGFLIDAPSTYANKNLTIKKYFTQSSGTVVAESYQNGQYNLLGCNIADFTETHAGNKDFVGGNFADQGTTPTTGHITFGAFSAGVGMTTSGTAFLNQAGAVRLPATNDNFIAEIPFAMYGVTSFQNTTPSVILNTVGGFGNQHSVINEGGITGGTFTISVYDASNVLLGTTAAQAYNVTTTNLDTALEGIAGVGTGVTVTGSLSTAGTGFSITFPTGQIRRITVDGSLLTGGTSPNVAYAFARMDTTTRPTTDIDAGTTVTEEFQVIRGDLSDWSGATWQAITGANLSAAIAAISGYNAGTTGFKMRIRITATSNDEYRSINQISMPTNINPTLWDVYDSTITFQGCDPTDIIKVKRASDNVTLYTFTGSGLKEFNTGANFDVPVYFDRENASNFLLMRTYPTTQKLSYGSNGTVNLFYGSEVQLANSSDVALIKAKVDLNLDATISSRCSQVTGNAIKQNTDLIPATL